LEETVRIGASNPLTTVKYQKINPDGTIWFREETIFQARVKKIVIRNGDGRFEIVGDSVIKDETPNALHPETVSAKPRPKPRFELIDEDTILFDKKTRITRSEKPEQFADLEKLLKEMAKGEKIGYLVGAIATGRRHVHVVNIPNKGAIPNLPHEAVLEIEGVTDSHGIRGVYMGEAPIALKGLLESTIAYQEVVVDAAIKGSKQLALQALMLDKMAILPDKAEAMLNALLVNSKNFLPQFKK